MKRFVPLLFGLLFLLTRTIVFAQSATPVPSTVNVLYGGLEIVNGSGGLCSAGFTVNYLGGRYSAMGCCKC